MKRIALAAVSAAFAGLTACSNASAPTAASASHRNAPVPVNCSQQYHIWEHGQSKGFIAALIAVSSAKTAGSRNKLSATLKKDRSALAIAARRPIPACADPIGYWNVLLMHVSAGVASTGSTSTKRAAMKDVSQLERKLIAELKRTTMTRTPNDLPR